MFMEKQKIQYSFHDLTTLRNKIMAFPNIHCKQYTDTPFLSTLNYANRLVQAPVEALIYHGT